MKPFAIIMLCSALLFTACKPSATNLASSPDLSPADLILTNGTLIDGTGADPIPNASVVIGDGRIMAIEIATQGDLPQGVEVIDLGGATILPGFINAHVHDAYNEIRLETWAQAGVTTVRDEGIISASPTISEAIALRDQLSISPQYARLISTGYMLTTSGGYGTLEVSSAEEARQVVNMELDKGSDQIKLTLESGYAGVSNLPLLSAEELKVIVETAHARGKQVTAHITEARYLNQLLDAGVDDLAHVPAGYILQAQLQALMDKNIFVVPTLTVFEAYGGLKSASSTLERLVEAGIPIAMGNDYTLVPQNGFEHFELGMPMHEITRMSEAGMSPMQIIVASTKNGAHVCGLEDQLGTLEVGKLADILIVNGNPLQDLSALTQVKMVIHNGVIIRR